MTYRAPDLGPQEIGGPPPVVRTIEAPRYVVSLSGPLSEEERQRISEALKAEPLFLPDGATLHEVRGALSSQVEITDLALPWWVPPTVAAWTVCLVAIMGLLLRLAQ